LQERERKGRGEEYRSKKGDIDERTKRQERQEEKYRSKGSEIKREGRKGRIRKKGDIEKAIAPTLKSWDDRNEKKTKKPEKGRERKGRG